MQPCPASLSLLTAGLCQEATVAPPSLACCMAPSLHTGPQAPGHKDDSGALVSASVLRGGYLNPLILGFLSIALQTYHSLLPRAVIASGALPQRLGVFVHWLTRSFIHSADYLLPSTCCEPGPRITTVNTTLLFLFLT